MAEKDNLDKYVEAFQDLNVDKKKHKYTAGKSPHKPVLLLSIIALYKNDKLNLRDIKPNQEIKEKWSELWKCLEYEESAPIWKPFYYMKSENFWNLEFSQNKEADSVTSLQSFNEVVEKVSLDKDLMELIDDEGSWLTLVDALLTGGYFSKEEKNKLASKIDLIDDSYGSDKNENNSADKEFVSEPTSDEEDLEDRISQNHIENIFDKSNIDTRELLEVFDTADDQLRLKLILALQSSQNSKILKDKKFKDKIIHLILVEDDSLVKENIRSLIHEGYDNHAYFINKLLALLNDDDPQIRSNVAESLKIFDTRRANKHLIDKLYDEEIEVRFSALKTLVQNDNYDLGEIKKALENWKTSLQILEKGEKEKSESEEVKTKKDKSVGKKEVVSENVSENLSWNEAVKEAIRRVVEREGDQTFSRQTLIEEEMDYIKKATGTEGSSPKQTLSRVLQELWKEEDFISHESKGVYKLQEREMEEELEGEITKEEISSQEKKVLLKEIFEEKIDLKEVKDQIILYSEDEYFLEQLIGNINDLDWKNRYQMVKIISEINEKIVLEKLTELLEDPNEWVREASAEALTNFPSEDIIPKLANVLKSSKKERSRIYATEILGEFDSEKALDVLSEALGDEASSVREEAMNSIDKISHEKSREIFKKAKKSDFPDVSSEAKRILKRPKYDTSENKKKAKKAEKNDSFFTKHSVYLRSKIHERLGGNENSKLSKSSGNNHVFLFYRKDEEYKHPFGWQDDGSFHFILDRFEHDIQFEGLTSLIEQKKNNQKIHLFRDLKENKAKYQGEMNIEKYNIIKVKGKVKKIILKLFPIEKSTKETNTNENKDSDDRESSKRSTMDQVSSDNERGKKENKDMLNNLKEEFKLD